MTTRLDQLPGGPDSTARRVAALERQLAELRAQGADLTAADALLPPLDADTTRWPQTTSGSFVTISRSYNLRWGSQLRLWLATAVGASTTGTVRVLIDNLTQFGPTTVAGQPFDYTGPLPASIPIGGQYQISVQAVRSSGGGAVSAQAQLIRSII
ncbi:hypothetical protein [Streptomyces sp. CB03911]|uniref:hypothetical protein n=1 Tax=Streptomyces sp. CB03911 TaxID=1804758 RepID=UPI00093E6BE0|nr:hypothetical protein [Streptomyces sp. CB03911]OKI22197.1 hypothetical protein A6A07_34545 [Streptomyces sp. CB03911]